ncbi:hypothetical protein GCM10009834_24930 [Streptomonospora arabica]
MTHFFQAGIVWGVSMKRRYRGRVARGMRKARERVLTGPLRQKLY